MRLRYRDERFAFVRFRLDGLIAKCGEFCLSFLSQWFCGILSQWYLFCTGVSARPGPLPIPTQCPPKPGTNNAASLDSE